MASFSSSMGYVVIFWRNDAELASANSVAAAKAEGVLKRYPLATLKLSFYSRGLSGVGMMALAGLVTDVDGRTRCGGAGTMSWSLGFFLGGGGVKLGVDEVRGGRMMPCLSGVDACILVMITGWRGVERRCCAGGNPYGIPCLAAWWIAGAWVCRVLSQSWRCSLVHASDGAGRVRTIEFHLA